MKIAHRIRPSIVRVFALSIAAGLVLAPPLTAEAQIEYEIISLGTLPGVDRSGARGINELGEVTGSASVAGGERHAFIWLTAARPELPEVEAETMYDL